MDKNYENIKRINASIGGFFGPSYSIEVHFIIGRIVWNASEEGVFTEPELIKQTDFEGVKMLIDDMRKCGILSWQKEYIDPHVLDGTHWSLAINLDDMCIEKSGSNAYPKEWKRFCKSMQKLVGKPFD